MPHLIAEHLTLEIQNLFGSRLLALYLYGSLVTGDFSPDRSDIDLLAVLSTEVTEEDIELLREMHIRFVGNYPDWEDRIDVIYTPVMALQQSGTKGPAIAKISPGEALHGLDFSRDYVLNWYLARRSGVSLFGRQPQELIPEISRSEFLTVVAGHARWWQECVEQMIQPGARAYSVLTLCRALYASVEGEPVSKKMAAEWAQPLLPQYDALIRWGLDYWYGEQSRLSEEGNLKDVVRFVKDLSSRVIKEITNPMRGESL